jgi:hypothetical protein
MAWAKNGTPDTLGSAGDTMDIADLTATKFNVYLSHALDNGSNIGSTLTFDGVGGTSYAQRTSAIGATDVTLTSRASLLLREQIKDQFEVGYFINITNEEKLVINFDISISATGAGTAPSRRELVGKFVQNAQVTQITNTNDQSGSFDTSSNLSALGTD